LRSKGGLTLPKELRTRYGFEEGDVFSVIDLGDGALLLTPRTLQVGRLGDRVGELLEDAGVSTEDMLKVLAEERERYYHEHYARD
jgi:bifunctional DNA-binding transcriptional regulator/antitoxin component of YhaV-PrlF toxin-antitoxin module